MLDVTCSEDGIRFGAGSRYDAMMIRTWNAFQILVGSCVVTAMSLGISLLGTGSLLAQVSNESGVGKVSNADLIRSSGRHTELVTDSHTQRQADEFVAAFDAAVPQWERFWMLSPGTLDSWKVDAYVMREREDFRRRDLIPERVPDFRFGYAMGKTVWVVSQPSQYYTRHLLLHEGAHALAGQQFGGAGPAWYMEGTAEMLSTHQGTGREVMINHIPKSRDEVPYWGRFKAIRLRRETQTIPSIGGVMGLPLDLDGDVESYAWSWAATMLLYAYPEYRDAFQAAARNGHQAGNEFNEVIRRRLASQWPVLAARWRLMCRDLNYGFDWQRERVALSTRDPLWQGQSLDMVVSANRGWQSVGVRFPPGTRIRIAATGRCTLAQTTAPWVSEPDGITIQYNDGIPLGKLIACVVGNAPGTSETEPVLSAIAIGEGKEITFDEHAWLLLRVNDGVDAMSDNTGGYRVEIEK